jgi:hypothetical protein
MRAVTGHTDVGEVIGELSRLGFQIAAEGEEIECNLAQGITVDPERARYLLAILKENKPEALAYLRARLGVVNPPCTTCPWCRENPWTHYPDWPQWCDWWFDHLLADSGWCSDKRDGRVPDPKPRDARTRKAEDLRPLNHAPTDATCYECAHFNPARSSPNPTQAWGKCRKLEKGRYGVARACDAYQLAARLSRVLEKGQVVAPGPVVLLHPGPGRLQGG